MKLKYHTIAMYLTLSLEIWFGVASMLLEGLS